MRPSRLVSSALRLALTLGFVCGCSGGGGDGEPVADTGPAACVEGERRCGVGLVEVCDDGDWTPVGLCDGDRICVDGACVPPPCVPDCTGAACGPDGCGGTCGACPADAACVQGRCTAVGVNPCGDGTCEPDEDCATCPADCGACCGDGACAEDEDCATCLADCPCGDGQRCDGPSRACVAACTPIDCATVECGDDGCGGACGACGGGETCLEGRCRTTCGDAICAPGEDCLSCPADCGGCCGDGACSDPHGEDCATCPADCPCPEGEGCDVEARACSPLCAPACRGRICGPDGCDGVCGVCDPGEVCDEFGRCAEPPARCGDGACLPADGEDCATCPADCGPCCGDGACAPDENCATCPADCACPAETACDIASRICAPLACTPDCFARICGPDGCGGACGQCAAGELCDPERGRCVVQCVPDCGPDDQCGPDGCGDVCGECADGDACRDRRCVPPCAPACDGRACGPDGCGGTCGPGCGPAQACTVDGQCVGGALGCACVGDDVCVAGVCRRPSRLCGPEAPDGFCPNAEICDLGVCVPAGQDCSLQNPIGVCPVGALCIGGGCRAFDPGALCDDGNPCTADVYEPGRDGCRSVPQEAGCSDGDPCTADACVDGACQGTPIADCVPPPGIDPVVSPTAEPRIILEGDKPAGWAIRVDGEPAVAAGPEVRWAVELELQPGENVFRVARQDGDTVSAAAVVRVVYDDDPPATRITPGGGVFRDGITVTLAATEPATVHYTTDGAVPDRWSPAFDSVRTLRIFGDTVLSVRARDRAGNWQPAARSERYVITTADGRWREGAALGEGRTGLTAAGDGARIFVVGGSDGAEPRADGRMYADGRWSDLPSLARPRAEAAAAWVDGALYVFGGRGEGIPLSQVERLEVDSPRGWDARRNLPSSRFGLQAVVVGPRVHLFGGQGNGGAVLDTHEVYDTVTDTWTDAVAPMPRPRYAFGALRAGNGRIHLVGGQDEAGRPVAEVDVYDPQTDTWSDAPPLPTPRAAVAVGRVANGGRVQGGSNGVLVSGGRTADGRPSAVVEEYVVDDAQWRTRRPLAGPRAGAAGVTIEGPAPGAPDPVATQAWVIGGEVAVDGAPQATPTAAWFTREQDHLRALPDLPVARRGPAAAALDDHIYVVGGGDGQPSPAVYAYDPETGDARPVAPLPGVQDGAAVVALGGRLWVIGGESRFGQILPTLRSYDPGTDTWSDHRPMLNARRDLVAAVVGGEIAAIGGRQGMPVQSVEFYDPDADRWRSGSILPEPRTEAVGGAWMGRVYIAGGVGDDGVYADVIELTGEGWQTVADAGFEVRAASAAVIDGRLIVFGGLDADDAPSDRRRILDLARGYVRHFPLEPDSRLLPAVDARAAAAHNGDVYLIGGAADGALPAVQRYAGRCLDGDFGPYEGRPPYADFPDLGAGCGEARTTVALDPAVGYGHHGSCQGWNDCGDARTCADIACAWFGHGPAHSFQSISCIALPSGDCDLFRGLGDELDTGFDAPCNVSVVHRVVCRVE